MENNLKPLKRNDTYVLRNDLNELGVVCSGGKLAFVMEQSQRK